MRSKRPTLSIFLFVMKQTKMSESKYANMFGFITFTGERTFIEIQSLFDRVIDIKEKVAAAFDVKTAQVILIYGNTVLQENLRPFNYYVPKNDAFIKVLFRMLPERYSDDNNDLHEGGGPDEV